MTKINKMAKNHFLRSDLGSYNVRSEVLGASLGGSVFWNFLIRAPEVLFLVPPKWVILVILGEPKSDLKK